MKVLAPNSDQARQDIEVMSDSCYPYLIRFVQDGAGQWFITYTVLNDSHFQSFRPFMVDNTHEITYVPPAEIE